MKRGNYNIIPLDVEGIYLVENLNNKQLYRVDVAIPSCNCDDFWFGKKNKNGKKKPCKHIQFCGGLTERFK